MNEVIPIRAHAKLSASGSGKWLVCTPSASLEDQFPDEQSAFAAEGTFAHAVFEQELLHRLGRPVDPLPQDLLHFDSADLRDHVQAAVDVALDRIREARSRCADPVILVEQRVDFSRWVPEGFGTGDLVIIADDLVEVMDLKYGKGYEVEAEGNSQMKLYALGAYAALDHLYDIRRVRMTILQPRLRNYASSELLIEDLLEWAETVVKPRAQLAWDGHGEYAAGDHCSSYFCRARATCAARAQHAMTLAKADFALTEPGLLTEEQICQVLARGDAVAKWIGDVQGYALDQAEKHGRAWPGYKLVEGRSNRKYADQDQVSQRLLQAGINEALIYERSLLGITAMEKALGKKKFTELLNDLVVKPSGKPTLVQDADKRPALSSVASAASDFS